MVKEETNLKFNEDSLALFLEDKAWRKLTNRWEARHFYYVRIDKMQLHSLEVYEGQGWVEIKGADDPNLVEAWQPVIKRFLEIDTPSS